MIGYIVVSIVSGILFGILDGAIHANPLAQRLYEVYNVFVKRKQTHLMTENVPTWVG